MSTQQDLIDQLIDYIDKAILKNSVSNRHVATVLSFLNEKLKDFAEGDTFCVVSNQTAPSSYCSY